MRSNVVVVPKYHQIYLVLREQILEGRFTDDFPGEHALAKTYGVSRITLRRTLEELQAEGLIERERGRRTRVLPPVGKTANAVTPTKTDIAGLLDNIISYGLKTSAKVLELAEIASSPEVAHELRIPPGSLVQKAVRVRSHRGEPMSFMTTYVPSALAEGLGRRELESKPLLNLLQERGICLTSVRQSIGAELADARVAEHLHIQVGSALLAVRRVVSDAQGTPVQFLLGLYRPDRYEYRMQLSAEGVSTTQVWTAD
ncbi:MAG: GntR family transcriptional regulator [Pigmentiphaga sp.]|nr:GntR family transcriptional regulator [Pigmentiphaga sp.]